MSFIFSAVLKRPKTSSKILFLIVTALLILSTFYIAITSDQQIPQIHLVSPKENSIVSNQIDLVIEIEGKYPIFNANLIHDEKEYVMNKHENQWIYELNTEKYSDGDFTFDISVYDTFGHENKKTFTILIDNTAPVIEIVERSSNKSLLFRIFDTSGIAAAKYILNGDQWEYLQDIGNSLYSTEVIVNKLSSGIQNFTVLAVDANGNDRIEKFILYSSQSSGNQDGIEYQIGEFTLWSIEPLDTEVFTYSFSGSNDNSYNQKHVVLSHEEETHGNLSIEITNPLEGDILYEDYVNATWRAEGNFDHFEILLDELSIGNTSYNWFFVEKVGTGWHTLKVIGYFVDGDSVFDSVYFDPIDPTYPVIQHSPFRDLNTTNLIETQKGLRINATVTDDIGVSKVLFESNYTGQFKNYTMMFDGTKYFLDIDISHLTGSNRFCYRFFANDTENKWTVTDRSKEYNTNAPLLNYFWVKMQYQIKKVIYWAFSHDPNEKIPIMQDLDVNGVVISWYLTKWHKDGQYEPGDTSVRETLQKYIDAGYEIYINLTVTKGTKVADVPYSGYKDGTQDRMATASGIATYSGDYTITIDRNSWETPIDYTTPENYWVVRDETDSQFLAYGTNTEEWSYANRSTTAIDVTIHNAQKNHDYTVYYLYHHWNRIDYTTLVGRDLVLTRMKDLLANHSDQITGIYLENMGFGGGRPYNPTTDLLDAFKTNQSIDGSFNNSLLYYIQQTDNASLWQAEWTEYSAKRIYEFFANDFMPLCSNFTVVVGWYRGDTNAAMSPEYMAKSGVLWEENWQGLGDWQGTREHLFKYEKQTSWAYNDDGSENIDYSLCHYIPSSEKSLAQYQAWVGYQRSLVAIGAYPERINIGQSTNNYGLGTFTPQGMYEGVKEWVNDFTQIHWILDNYDEYTIADVGLTNKYVMRSTGYGKIWYHWNDRVFPINFRYVNMEDITNDGVPAGVDVLWLHGPYGGAVDNATMEEIQMYIEGGGGLLVTNWNATHYNLNMTTWLDTAIKELIGVNQTGSTTYDDDYDMIRTADGETHWISEDLPNTLAWNENAYGDMVTYNSGMLSNYQLLYAMAADSDDVGMSVAELGSGRVAFILQGFTAMKGSGGYSDGDTALQLYSRTLAWLSQNEDSWTWPTVNNDYIAAYLYNTTDSFMIAVFNNHQTNSETFTLNFNSTPLGFADSQYVMFDAYNWEAVNSQPFFTRINGELSFTKTIDTGELMMIICKPYGSIIHLHSNRTFLNEYWDDTNQIYNLIVNKNGFSAISSPFKPSSISEQGYFLGEVDSFSKLATVESGWYYDVFEEIIYLKSFGGNIAVDYKAPAIVLISPSNNSVVEDNQIIDLDIFDLQDNLDTVLYNWNGNDNTTLTENYDLVILPSFYEGINILNIYANDTDGYSNHLKFTFDIDNIIPSCTLVSPLNGSTLSGVVNVHINAYDEHLDKVYLIIDSSITLEVTNHVNDDFYYALDTTTLSNGYHSLQAEAIDSIGHQNFSLQIHILIDNQYETIDGDTGGGGGGTSSENEENKNLIVSTEFSETSVFHGEKIYITLNITDDLDNAITDAFVELEFQGNIIYCYLTNDGLYTGIIDTIEFNPGVYEVIVQVEKSGYSSYEETESITIQDWILPRLLNPESVKQYLSDYSVSMRVGIFSIIIACLLLVVRDKVLRAKHRRRRNKIEVILKEL